MQVASSIIISSYLPLFYSNCIFVWKRPSQNWKMSSKQCAHLRWPTATKGSQFASREDSPRWPLQYLHWTCKWKVINFIFHVHNAKSIFGRNLDSQEIKKFVLMHEPSQNYKALLSSSKIILQNYFLLLKWPIIVASLSGKYWCSPKQLYTIVHNKW